MLCLASISINYENLIDANTNRLTFTRRYNYFHFLAEGPRPRVSVF
jgi:hypothetical protein